MSTTDNRGTVRRGGATTRGPEHDAASAAVARARRAGRWWDGLGFAGRRRYLRRWAGLLARHMPRLAVMMRRQTGKPLPIGVTEITYAVDHLVWAANNARRVLSERRVPGSLLAPEYSGRVAYRPCGVVGVIGPTDFPVYSPLSAMAYALAAGNAVILKPSEYAPGVGKFLVDAFAKVVGGVPVAQLLPGDGRVGLALCSSGVDMMAFTGSPSAGRAVMAACAENMTPVVLESGGEDAMIVDVDADAAAAAEAACFGAFANSGQTCVGIQRVYAVDEIYDEFLMKLTQATARLTVGTGGYDDLGPITKPERIDVISRHIADAIDRGACVVWGGPDAIVPPFVKPTILTEVPVDADIMREETPGPVLTVTRADSAHEALSLANGASYGLGGAVFGQRNAAALARGMRSGMTSVNSVLGFVALPACPFGGTGGTSGFGRINGEDGLRAFTQVKAITSRRFPSPIRSLTFARDARATTARLARALRLRHGNYR